MFVAVLEDRCCGPRNELERCSLAEVRVCVTISLDCQFTPKYAKTPKKTMIAVMDIIFFGVVFSGSMWSKNMIKCLWFYFLVLKYYRNQVCNFGTSPLHLKLLLVNVVNCFVLDFCFHFFFFSCRTSGQKLS